MDSEKTCVAVTVYNLAKGRGVTVGDTVVIPEPFLTHQSFSFASNVSHTIIIEFRCDLNSINNRFIFVFVTEFRF